MGLLEAIGLVSIKESAERLKKLQDSFNEKIKWRDTKIKSLEKKVGILTEQKSILREKLYKANKWQIHIKLRNRDLSHSNISTLLESALLSKVNTPYVFKGLESFSLINQEGRVEVIHLDKPIATEYLYFSYTID